MIIVTDYWPRGCHQFLLYGNIAACPNRTIEKPVMTPRRYALRDDQWDRIQDLLPGRPGSVGVTARDNRWFIDAVLYRYRSGSPWRDLPEYFGDFRVVHTRFSRWARTGVWARVFETLAADADNAYAMLDSTIVRAHQHSAGAQKKRGATRPSGAARVA